MTGRNIRELENSIQRAVILAETIALAEDLPEPLQADLQGSATN
jgi:DNA-binding NtrC family response regulator